MEQINEFKFALINGLGSKASRYEIVVWPARKKSAIAYNAMDARILWMFHSDGESGAASISMDAYFQAAKEISELLGAFASPDQSLKPAIWAGKSSSMCVYSFKTFGGPPALPRPE